jgi:hypothetical protein
LQTGQIELQNNLERLAKLGSKMSVTLLKRAAATKVWRISCSGSLVSPIWRLLGHRGAHSP